MVFTSQEIEQRRSAAQLSLFVQDVRKRVESDPDEMRRARKLEGVYRAFVNEVIPLSRFAHLLYRDDATFRPVLGNQGFDVEVFGGDGQLIDRVEIAKPHDGKAEALDSKLFETRGYGEIRLHDFGEELEALVPWITDSAQSKSLKDYSDCTLVIVAAMDPPYLEELPKIEQRSKELVARLEQMIFCAKRAFLAVPALDKCFAIES